MLTTLEPRPRLSYSMVESVLGELSPDSDRIESETDAIFQNVLNSGPNQFEQTEPMIQAYGSSNGSSTAIDQNHQPSTSVNYFPDTDAYQPFHQNFYSTPPQLEDWRVPPIDDSVQPGWTSVEYQSYDIHLSNNMRNPISYQPKPKQSRRSSADLDKKRIHKCNYQGKFF